MRSWQSTSTPADEEAILERRMDPTRLGFAIQLGTVRFLGTFVADPAHVPRAVVEHVAAQLGIDDLSALTSTAKALRDLSRIIKTLFLLTYIDDVDYQQRIHVQLNRHESRHSLARALFHGERGQLRQKYREGQEDQLSALGLVVNIVALWNTIYCQAALDRLRSAGSEVATADIARLSPLGHKHINFRGQYKVSHASTPAPGELRPLHGA